MTTPNKRRDDAKKNEVKRSQNALLRRKLIKKAINTTRNKRPAPPIRKPIIDKSKLVPVAVRKTKTATEAATGVQKGWRKLYVGDLYETTTTQEIRHEFGKYGKIFDIWIARNPPGFAFVDFMDSRDAARALRNLDGSHKLGKSIKVEFAKTIGPRTASAKSAIKKRLQVRSRVRTRRFSGSRSMRLSPDTLRVSPPPIRHSYMDKRMLSRRRSPVLRGRRMSPPLGRHYAPSPPPPPLFDPYDPHFREMALVGGWGRSRSPMMGPPHPLPPPPPPHRYRSRSPSPPRYRGRSPVRRRSPPRSLDRSRGRLRDDKYASGASLVYPPLSLPPPSFSDVRHSPPRRMRSPPPRRGSPMRIRSPPRGPSPPPMYRARSPMAPRSRQRSPMQPRSPPHKMRGGPSPPPMRGYLPPPRMAVKSPVRRSRGRTPPHGYPRGNMSPPIRNNDSWHSPNRQPLGRRSPPPRSRSRSPVMRSPPRPRSPPPPMGHVPRDWSPPQRGVRSPPRRYSPPSASPHRSRSNTNHTKHGASPPGWSRSPAPRSPEPLRNSIPRPRTPPRGYTPPQGQRFKSSMARTPSPPPMPRSRVDGDYRRR